MKIEGFNLTAEQRSQVLAAFQFRETIENKTSRTITDADWVNAHDFMITTHGDLALGSGAIAARPIRPAKTPTRATQKAIDTQYAEMSSEMSRAAKKLKQFAKDYDIAVIALSQLKRGGDINKRPTVQDLKESGDLEAAADVVILNYRPKDLETGHYTGEDELIIGKQREGDVGTLLMHFDQDTLAADTSITRIGPDGVATPSRVQELEAAGYYIGPRDLTRNRAFAGRFMVCENLTSPPTDDASTGGFCIVGDDLNALIEEAHQRLADVPEL